ncbi:hypothetical protein A9Q84_18705 [Halobacteriovorax marinus]|uniref:Uncharacterized protein n=1 Tax=Halobacteriovorax marinus TaxID=97084 RepID=A0A1Y5F268_9BACT|nr:hypothetical protein A9Q84_18705 [Halobacteriovorax marinus]
MKRIFLTYILLISASYSSPLEFLELKSLSLEHVAQLTSAYQKAQGLHNEQNERELSHSLPIISTNPHHHSVRYWLRAQLKNQNLRGLPILHLDSHTDMGFSPSHYKVKDKYYKVSEILNNLTPESIESFHSSLTDISQVLIPAMASKLTNEFHMCMPPWYSRTDLFNKEIPFHLYEFNRANFVGAKMNRLLPVTKIVNTFTSSPFIHSDKYLSNTKAEMTFFRCFTDELPNLKGDYILSLDLDILSTNGVHGDHARPISTHRDRNGEVSVVEFKAFKNRLKKILTMIKKLKARGSLPRIITIADSTETQGGNYTPTALALLANQYLKRELNKLLN